jgi:glycosyltransferase involved in cell wall biosynthesis
VDSVRPRVSVIVPVRNGAIDVVELLASLERQTLPRGEFEIVIGDDGSTDGGTEGIETVDNHVRVAAGSATNSYAARNRAVTASNAPILAFCDADCRPDPAWLEHGLAALADTDIAAGRIRFDVPQQRTAWSLVDMDASKDHEHQVRVGIAETANLFLRRELYDRVGGFEGDISEYGDYEFVERCVAAGAELSYAPDAIVSHPVRTSGRALLRALWKYNRGYAVHAARDGRRPEGLKLRSLVPIVQTLRSRWRWGRSLGPDGRWLRANGVEPALGETLAAVAIMYVLLPYLASAAQLVGWIEGRRLRVTEASLKADRTAH